MYTQIFSILIVTLLVALGLTALFSFGLFVWFFLRMLIAQQDGELFYRNKIKWSAALFGISIGGLFLSGAAGSILVSKVQENIDRSNDDQKTMAQRYGASADNMIRGLFDKYTSAKTKAQNNTKLTNDFGALESRIRSLFKVQPKQNGSTDNSFTADDLIKSKGEANSGIFLIISSDLDAFLKN